MHPFLITDLAAAHMADLLRDAASTCCARAMRSPLVARIRAAVRSGSAGTARACCPA